MSDGFLSRVVAAARRGLAALPVSSWAGVRAGFIVSTGRTGTLRLAQVLAESAEGGLALHEPGPDLFDLGEGFARGEITEAGAAARLRRARQPLCNRVAREGLDWYVESNTNAAYLPAAIRAVFDGPRFIHVVRDGRAVVRSLYSKTNPGRDGERALFMSPDDHRDRLSAPDFPGDPWSAAWPDLNRFQRICWHWAKKNALIREALAGRDDALVVRFEDVFDAAAGYPGFFQIVDFLGLPSDLARSGSDIRAMLGTRANRPAEYLLPPPDEWPEELAADFDRIAGPEQLRYYP